MNKLLTGVAALALLVATPTIAAEKSAKSAAGDSGSDLSEMLKSEGQNREPGEDGTFQGKPVVEGPADFSDLAPTGADSSAGASSGEAGDSLGNKKAGSGSAGSSAQ